MSPSPPPTAGPVPVPNSTRSFWRTQLHPLDNHRTTEQLPAESDIVIIGAGFAGAALAHFICEEEEEKNNRPSVLILEAREACSGASARNGGHVKPDVYFNVPTYIKKYGVKAAVEAAKFEKDQVLAVKELVEKNKIDCDFVLTRACDATLHAGFARETHEAFEELSRSGVIDVQDVYHAYGKDAERLSGVKGALSSFTFTAAHLWPYKMIMHLLQTAVNRGANLQTHTPVVSVSETPDAADGTWLVTTKDRGSVKAKKVLFATNGYTANLAPQFKDHIVPVRGICSRIVTKNKDSAPFLPYTYSIRYGPGLYDYLIPRADGSIIVGGAKPNFWADRSHWYNVWDDSKLIEVARSHFDNLMQRTFLGWEKSEARTDKVWTGIMGWSSDFMPYIGHVPGKPGQMILAGFSGHGMPLILNSARAVVQMVRQGKKYEDTALPSIFRVTEERLASTENAILSKL